MIVEISTHGSVLKRDHELFVIVDKDGKRSEVPAEKIDCILVSANALVSTAAIRLCLERHIQLVITQYSGRPIARMWSSTPGRASQIRRRQYMLEQPAVFEICRKILLAKIRRQKRLLAELQHNRKTDGIDDVIASIAGTSDVVRSQKYGEGWKVVCPVTLPRTEWQGQRQCQSTPAREGLAQIG